MSTGNMYNPGSISVSWNGFSHKFVRVSTSYASSVWSAFLKPNFTNDPEGCICI